MTVSKPPRHQSGGFCNPSALPKGPNGRALCRQCSVEVPRGRQTFCGDQCVEAWKVRTGNGLDRIIEARDHGICALCGVDCEALKTQRRRLRGSDLREFNAQHGIPESRTRLWDIDHIIPVVNGGGSCGLENLRTVCIKCHAQETKKLAGLRADARRDAKEKAHPV